MSSVGPYLRELRERRGVSLEEIARTTRVGRSYLEALEAGDFGKLPAHVFTRGFVLAYCQALGVSADEALARYGGRAESQGDPSAVPAGAAAPATAPARDRATARARGPVLVSFVLLIVLGVALFAVALVLQSGREGEDRRTDTTRSGRRETPRPPARPEPAPADNVTSTTSVTGTAVDTATSPSRTAAPSAPATGTPPPARTPTVTSSPSTTAPATSSPATTATAPTATVPTPSRPPAPSGDRAMTAPPAVTPASPSTPPATTLTQQDIAAAVGSVTAPYRLIARTTATTWIRVRTDDGRQTEETLGPGQVREWVSNRPFTISLGNAGGVKLELNGRTLPPLGPTGAVIGRLVLPSESP
jgi:cytoskeleton protein RodZ